MAAEIARGQTRRLRCHRASMRPRRMAAEIANGWHVEGQDRFLASMRPRRMAAEIPVCGERHTVTTDASMRPRRMAAEI